MDDGGGGNRWRSPNRGSPGSWHSPRFNNRGNNNFSPTPRYQGGNWQQRSPSPYPHHGPHNPPSFITSTPIHHRPHYSGGRGGHRQFNSPRSSFNRSEEQGIEAWINPAMWEDPWKQFEQQEAPEEAPSSKSSSSVEVIDANINL